jgi:hypothetical protein
MDENQYWRDFYSGKSLRKYGVKLIGQFEVDIHTGGWLLVGVY